MANVPPQDYTKEQYRAIQRLRHIRRVGATATPGNYPGAGAKELDGIRDAAARLALMVANAARLPVEE